MLSRVENRYQPAYTPWKPQIQNKTVIFTGDENGIGHAAAVLLASHGAPVFLAARSAAALKQAFLDINRAGGECDGMAVDWNRAEDVRRFIMLAKAWLGGIDTVITPPVEETAAGQNLWIQEAMQHMQAAGCGQIINIELPGSGEPQNWSERRLASALRRQAREMGIRITLIELDAAGDESAAQEAARCILESVAQPDGSDAILAPGHARTAY